MEFACIHIPDFPVQASLLPETPETRAVLAHSLLAILDGPANLPRVFAINSAARRAGVQIGMTKLQAEICVGIELRKRSQAEEESAQVALLDCAAEFSPCVESTAPGTVIFDLSGTEKLFGRQKDSRHNNRQESSWPRALQIMTEKATAAGFNVRIAIAANPDTAFLAARGLPKNTIIPAGDEARSLAPLPVETLPLPPEMRETLHRWGVRTFQSLAALPAVALVERLGQEGLYIQKLARGEIARPLLTFEPHAEFAASFEFDDPVETLESIFFILHRLLQNLCTRLLSTAQAAGELRLAVGLNVRRLQSEKSRRIADDKNNKEGSAPPEDGDQSEHTWELPAPTQDKNLLFSLLRLHLEQTSFSAPVRWLRLEVIPVKPRLAQGNLFAPPSPEPEKLELTLERIRGVVGPADSDGASCAGSPCLLDTHKPGSFALQHFPSIQDSRPSVEPHVPCGSSFYRSPAPSRNSIIALRIFRPALESTVELNGQKPYFVRLWNRHRRVLATSGPWLTSGNWWNAAAWTREEWDVAIQTPAGVGFYRIYRDRLRRQWFVEGVFD